MTLMERVAAWAADVARAQAEAEFSDLEGAVARAEFRLACGHGDVRWLESELAAARQRLVSFVLGARLRGIVLRAERDGVLRRPQRRSMALWDWANGEDFPRHSGGQSW